MPATSLHPKGCRKRPTPSSLYDVLPDPLFLQPEFQGSFALFDTSLPQDREELGRFRLSPPVSRYCASVNEQEIREGLQIVERRLGEMTVRAGEQELFKARAKELGQIRVIDIISARLDAVTDSFVATLPSLQLNLEMFDKSSAGSDGRRAGGRRSGKEGETGDMRSDDNGSGIHPDRNRAHRKNARDQTVATCRGGVPRGVRRLVAAALGFAIQGVAFPG